MDFTPLRISTVKPNHKLTFDLYIHFKDHYLCYTKRGEELSVEKFQKLKKQKIAKFYISEADEINYQNFLDALLDETLSNPNTDPVEKINLAGEAASSAVERMSKNPTEGAYKATAKAAKGLRQLISSTPDMLKEIFGKKVEKNEEIIKHSLNVSALALKLAASKKCSEADMDNLGIAALIHDIGLANLPPDHVDLFYKDKKNMTVEEKKIFFSHCNNAEALLGSKPFVNPAILQMVINHEEVLSGDGPNKKKKLTPTEEILSLVNNYDKRILTRGITPQEALKELMIDELGNYSLDLLNHFKKVLQEEGLIEN